MQLSPDGSRLAAAFENGDIHIWDALTKDEVAVLRGSPQDCKSCATNIAWSADGSKLAVTGRNSQAVVWAVAQQQKLWSFKHGTGDTNIIAYPVFSPDGRFLATALYHEAIYVWDLVRGIEIDHHHAAYPPVFSQDGNRLVLVGEVGDALPFDENGQGRAHNVLYLWDFAAHHATTFMTQGSINCPVLSVDGSKIFLLDGYKSYKLETWDPITGTMIRSLEIATPEDGILLYPQFSNDRRKLLLNWTANNKTIIVKKVVSVWDVEAGKEMFKSSSRAYTLGLILWVMLMG